jgi:hypothetical protein
MEDFDNNQKIQSEEVVRQLEQKETDKGDARGSHGDAFVEASENAKRAIEEQGFELRGNRSIYAQKRCLHHLKGQAKKGNNDYSTNYFDSPQSHIDAGPDDVICARGKVRLCVTLRSCFLT